MVGVEGKEEMSFNHLLKGTLIKKKEKRFKNSVIPFPKAIQAPLNFPNPSNKTLPPSPPALLNNQIQTTQKTRPRENPHPKHHIPQQIPPPHEPHAAHPHQRQLHHLHDHQVAP